MFFILVKSCFVVYFREKHDTATVKCYPTFVRYLPTGNETGRFLALDLGGTNFRVLLVTIGENKEFSMESKIFAIPKEIMIGTGNALFDHIAECLVEFVVENELTDETLPLGFTFSFPCKQEGLAKVFNIKYFFYKSYDFSLFRKSTTCIYTTYLCLYYFIFREF